MAREQIRVLILDDDGLFCRTLTDSLMRSRELDFVIVATTTHTAARQAVLDAAAPFDVFLIDQRLGPDLDGIQILEELRQLSPTSEAIIFTGIDDSDAGLRAYRAGAHRYLTKPFDTRELVWILRSLRRWHDTQYERAWLEVLNAVAEDAQRALSMHEVAAVVVRGSLQLGFERARLWLLSESRELLVGASQAGANGMTNFVGLCMPVSQSVYTQRALQKHEPSFFQGQEHGAGYLQRHPDSGDFKLPRGEWLMMPLWAAERCLGVLALDNASQDRPLRPEQRRLLSLFGRQVAAALERARKSKGLEVLNEIGRRITAHAAQGNLDQLLHEIHAQVGQLMDARNFKVVLVDREAGQLDFRLHVEDGRAKPAYRWRRLAGLAWHLIDKNEPLLLPDGDGPYLDQQGLRRYGSRCRSWLGVPLHVGDAAVGCIVVWSDEREHVYDDDDQRVLMAVADQVAGVIQTALLNEREKKNRQLLAMLNSAGAEMMRLAEENEDWLWHTILTAATAEYALCFNRAILLLAEAGGAHLRGRLGIGHFEIGKAHRAWREDPNHHFKGYLRQLRSGQLQPTPVETFIRQGLVLDVSGDTGAFDRVLCEGHSVLVPAAQAAQLLPDAFVESFGTADYAVLPLRAGTKVLGLVVVDNIHNKQPLHETAIRHFETLLAQAALTWETLRQRRARDKLIELNYTVMAELTNRPLKETLTQVCQMAQAVTDADSTTIYVLKPGREPYEFDADNTTAIGHQTDEHLRSIPRPKGISAHILRSGPLVIPDIMEDHARYNGQRLVEHPFHQAEQLRASIGVPLRDRSSGESLGVMYVNSRTPHAFGDQDIRHVESFASLAALAIRNTWAAQRARRNLATVEAERHEREAELGVLRRVLTEALAADQGEEKVIRALLNAAQELLDQPDTLVKLLLLEWERPGQSGGNPPEVRGHVFRNADVRPIACIVSDPFSGAVGSVLRSGQSRLIENADGSSRLVVPITLGAQAIGAFDMEAPAAQPLSHMHGHKLERLAAAAALALDNVRRQKHLYTVLKAAQTVMTPLGLHETLNAVMEAAQDAAADLSALTIWYREPESGRIVLGPYFGVRHESGMRREEPAKNSVVQMVMGLPEPLWAIDAKGEPRLISPQGRFIADERVESAAAFPLRADDEVVGAMFLNYRKRHEFTVEERALFPILAAIAAASLRDAARLEITRKQQQDLALALETTQKQQHRLEAALEITRAIGTTLDLNETLRQIMATLHRFFARAKPSVLTLTYDPSERTLEFTTVSHEFYTIDNSEYAGWRQVPIDQQGIACGLARAALSSKQVEYINVGDVSQSLTYLQLNSSTRSELGLTLMSGEQLLGVLVLESPALDAFSDDDVALVRGVGQQISIALDRAYQSAQLRFKTTVAATTAWAVEIAHDINREVGYIRNRAYWLREDLRIPRDNRQYAREIDESAARLAGTLGEASLWSAQACDDLCLDDWLKQWVGEMIADRCGEVRVQYEPGCADLEIYTRPIALQRVLRHLMRNALEAMDCTGRLTVRTRCLAGDRVEIQIEDTGPGVPERLRSLIFHQPITTREKKQEGGFGLLFVRSTVESLGGTVRLLPQRRGCGSIFAVTLPRQLEGLSREV